MKVPAYLHLHNAHTCTSTLHILHNAHTSAMVTCAAYTYPFTSLIPRPLPDFPSQLWRKSGSGLGMFLPFVMLTSSQCTHTHTPHHTPHTHTHTHTHQGYIPNSKDYRLQMVEFGHYEVYTWYPSPYPLDYTQLTKVYICEFCLKYFKSSITLHKHAVSTWSHMIFNQLHS